MRLVVMFSEDMSPKICLECHEGLKRLDVSLFYLQGTVGEKHPLRGLWTGEDWQQSAEREFTANRGGVPLGIFCH